VLPFATTSGGAGTKASAEDSPQHLVDALKGGADAGQDFNDGLSEQLVAALARYAGVAVTSPESSFQQRDPNALRPAIGQKLGATHLLQGSATRNGDALHFDAALVRVADGSTVWFERYRRPYRQLFQVQDEMATAIGAAL